MAKNTKHKHIKQQKEAAAGKRIIHITHVLNKYSGIEVPSTFKLGLCFWIGNVSVINNFRQSLIWAIISVLSKSICCQNCCQIKPKCVKLVSFGREIFAVCIKSGRSFLSRAPQFKARLAAADVQRRSRSHLASNPTVFFEPALNFALNFALRPCWFEIAASKQACVLSLHVDRNSALSGGAVVSRAIDSRPMFDIATADAFLLRAPLL